MKILLTVLTFILGAATGYLYYKLIGCKGGCPMASNVWANVVIGAIFGYLLLSPVIDKLIK
ncbi:MAG: hypothetical protein J7K29_01995 [Candidatus Cloacimonetes bacterium]|nr:hypothetical protein [Candidatus Cloacimonadota bacterium]